MTYERANRIIRAGINSATEGAARWALEEVRLVDGYAEPGYGGLDPEGAIVALGDWNNITRWDPESRQSVMLDSTPSRVGNLLEKAGVELEWSDEWTECAECGRAVRTQADSYSWTRSYVESDEGPVCEDCTLADPVDYLESLEGESNKAITLDVDPEEHGYVRIPERFENGLYGGQSADPRKIAQALEDVGCYRFIFRIDSVGQFDMRFSVYIHEDEMETLGANPEGTASYLAEEGNGVDPAEQMKRALANIPAAPSGPGIAYTKVDLSTGTATTRRVSEEEFIEGIRG